MQEGRGKGHVSSPIPPPPIHRHHKACLGFRHTCPLVLFAVEMVGGVRVMCFGEKRGPGRVCSLRRGWPPNCWVQYFLCNWRRQDFSASCPAVDSFFLHVFAGGGRLFLIKRDEFLLVKVMPPSLCEGLVLGVLSPSVRSVFTYVGKTFSLALYVGRVIIFTFWEDCISL